MATRARIGIENSDGTIRSIYLHWDGYPEGAGRILREHYQTREQINALLDLGDISSLGWEYDEEFAKKDWSNTAMTDEEKEKQARMTFPYKDRGEDTPARIDANKYEFTSKAGNCGEEYLYLWEQDYDGIEKWRFMETPYFKELTQEDVA